MTTNFRYGGKVGGGAGGGGMMTMLMASAASAGIGSGRGGERGPSARGDDRRPEAQTAHYPGIRCWRSEWCGVVGVVVLDD